MIKYRWIITSKRSTWIKWLPSRIIKKGLIRYKRYKKTTLKRYIIAITITLKWVTIIRTKTLKRFG